MANAMVDPMDNPGNLLVLTDNEFKMFEDGTQLVDLLDHFEWVGRYQWCEVTMEEGENPDTKMRETVTKHVRDHYEEYGVHPEEDLNIYPFTAHGISLRPGKVAWDPHPGQYQPYVYVIPSRLDDKDGLIFVKSYSKIKRGMIYRGALAISGTTILRHRLEHLLTMCNDLDYRIPPTEFKIIQMLDHELFKLLDLTKTAQELGLKTGDVIIVQPNIKEGLDYSSIPSVERDAMDFTFVGDYTIPTLDDQAVMREMLDRVFRGEGTNVAISSTSSPLPYRFTVHRDIIDIVPYFKWAFTSGLSESRLDDSHVYEFKVPFECDELVFRQFITFAYLRSSTRIARLSQLLLVPLLRLADYYSLEDLVNSISVALAQGYSSLTPEIAVELLTILHPLTFKDKEKLQHMVLTYIVFNFAEVGMLREFCELDEEVYAKVVNYLSQPRWGFMQAKKREFIPVHPFDEFYFPAPPQNELLAAM